MFAGLFGAFKSIPGIIIAALLVACVALLGLWRMESARAQAQAAEAGHQKALATRFREESIAKSKAINALQANYRASRELVTQTEDMRQSEARRMETLNDRLKESLAHDAKYKICRNVRLPDGAIDAIERMREPAGNASPDH